MDLRPFSLQGAGRLSVDGDGDGRSPRTIDDLQQQGNLRAEDLEFNDPADGTPKSWLYFPHTVKTSSGRTVVFATPRLPNGTRLVVCIDGRVFDLADEEFLKYCHP
ncbi:MAG: hypothetical protein ACR2OZ_05560 [Verrucomicrobiales bacterium]